MNEITEPPAPSPAPGQSTPYTATGPTPPSKGKRVLFVVGGLLATVAAVVSGRLAVSTLFDTGPDRPADAGQYKLVPPASFQGLTLQDSGPRVDAIKQGQGTPRPGTAPVSVVYADQAGTAQLVISGSAGTFADKDPGAAITTGLTSMGVKPTDITQHEAGKPAGGAMRCGPLDVQGSTLTLCMWADHSSLVTVTVPVENAPVTIDALAERARALREVMEVPAS
ncbi:hypothetical protein OOK31_30655 [Streptomyces sp. NBC_00249]|uniref:hypothetical protein n=1 Tax=Streptomyces sp. NBC_00249 TaxID=2975690 RepID=UPI002258CDD6|nr:hypothetical protein [Streptomyces sp. NBC_00249]MCX5198202.1 hypothetical protein [Streptomyces sp. NBC_00249]